MSKINAVAPCTSAVMLQIFIDKILSYLGVTQIKASSLKVIKGHLIRVGEVELNID